jgi:hypothetical protein
MEKKKKEEFTMLTAIGPWAPAALILRAISWILENVGNIIILIIGGSPADFPMGIQDLLTLLYSWL